MDVVFQNHAGKVLSLTQWPLMLQDEEKLLKVTRSYTSTERRAEGISIDRWYKRSQEFSLTVAVFADSAPAFYALLDQLEALTAADIAARSPGRLYVNGKSYLPAYISGWEVSEWEEDAWATDLTLTVLSPYPYWITETTLTYLPTNANRVTPAVVGVSLVGTAIVADEKRYPYQYPHRYSNSLISSSLTNPAIAPCGFRMVVFGPCDHPIVYIDGHAYSVSVTLNTDQYLTIDSGEKSIVVTDADGGKTNCIHLRDRQSYVFHPIPTGTVPITRSDNFGVDITLIEERSEPRWT